MFAIIICSLLIFCIAFSHEVTAAEDTETGTISMKRQHEAMETLDRQRNVVATKDVPRAAPGQVKVVEDSCKQCQDLFAGGHH